MYNVILSICAVRGTKVIKAMMLKQVHEGVRFVLATFSDYRLSDLNTHNALPSTNYYTLF